MKPKYVEICNKYLILTNQELLHYRVVYFLSFFQEKEKLLYQAKCNVSGTRFIFNRN